MGELEPKNAVLFPREWQKTYDPQVVRAIEMALEDVLAQEMSGLSESDAAHIEQKLREKASIPDLVEFCKDHGITDFEPIILKAKQLYLSWQQN